MHNQLEKKQNESFKFAYYLLLYVYVCLYLKIQFIKKDKEESESCAIADIDIDDGIDIKTESKSPKSSKISRLNVEAEIKLSDEEKRQIFDTIYDDSYEIVLPNTLWGKCLVFLC